MKPFCHHINFYFTVEEEGWPPCGEKIKDGVSKQMEVWKGNRGLQIMVTMGWDGMGWSPGLAVGSERPGSGGAKGGRVPPFSAEKFLLTFWPAEVC